MTATFRDVGARRYRESFGRCLNDHTVGGVYEQRPGRTISEADNTCFTLLAIVTGMSVRDLSHKAVANLDWDKDRLTAPVFNGDTICAESENLSVRESGSRPDRGMVTARTTGKTSDGRRFTTNERAFLAPKRGHAVDDAPD